MECLKHSAAAVVIALVSSQVILADTGFEKATPGGSGAAGVVASDYDAGTNDGPFVSRTKIDLSTVSFGPLDLTAASSDQPSVLPITRYAADRSKDLGRPAYSYYDRPAQQMPMIAYQPPGANSGQLPPWAASSFSSFQPEQSSSGSAGKGQPAACGCAGCSRIRFFGEALYLRAGDASVVYTEERNGCDPLLSSPTGSLGIAETDPDLGFRVGFAIPFRGCNKIVTSYTWYESDTSSDIFTTAPGNVLRSTVVHPSVDPCGVGSLAASADYDLGFQFIDIDLSWPIGNCGSSAGDVNWIVGLRYGHLDQQFRARQVVGALTGLATVDTDINFDGIGVRFGIEGETHSGCGLFLYGRGIASLVGGEYQASFRQTNQFGGSAIIGSDFEEYRVTTILDAAVGFGWRSPCRAFRILAGYEVNAWLNSLNTDDFIQGVRAGDVADRSSGLTFDGLFLRCEIGF